MAAHSTDAQLGSGLFWLFSRMVYCSFYLFFVVVAAIFTDSAAAHRPFLIYLAVIWLLSILLAKILGGKKESGQAVINKDQQWNEVFWSMLYFDFLGIGLMPAFTMFGSLSLRMWVSFTAIWLIISALMCIALKRQRVVERGLFSFANVFMIGFYLFIGPLYLARHIYYMVHGYLIVGPLDFTLLLAVLIVLLVLEIMLGFFIGASRDLSGAYETSFLGKWVYKDTKERVRWATKRETGEWLPPMRTVFKYMLVQGILIVASLFLGKILSGYCNYNPLRWIDAFVGRFISSHLWRNTFSVYVLLLCIVVAYYYFKSHLVNLKKNKYAR